MGIRLDPNNGDTLIDAVTYGPRGVGRNVCMRSRSEVHGLTIRTTSWVNMTVLGRTMTMTTVMEMSMIQLAKIAGYKMATGFVNWITRRKKKHHEPISTAKPPRQ